MGWFEEGEWKWLLGGIVSVWWLGVVGDGGVAEVVGVQAGQHQEVCRLITRYSRSEGPAQIPWTLWPPTPQN